MEGLTLPSLPSGAGARTPRASWLACRPPRRVAAAARAGSPRPLQHMSDTDLRLLARQHAFGGFGRFEFEDQERRGSQGLVERSITCTRHHAIDDIGNQYVPLVSCVRRTPGVPSTLVCFIEYGLRGSSAVTKDMFKTLRADWVSCIATISIVHSLSCLRRRAVEAQARKTGCRVVLSLEK